MACLPARHGHEAHYLAAGSVSARACIRFEQLAALVEVSVPGGHDDDLAPPVVVGVVDQGAVIGVDGCRQVLLECPGARAGPFEKSR